MTRLTNGSTSSPQYYLPGGTEPHAGTIIAWPTKRSIVDTTWSYPGANVKETRKELAGIARAIAKYEPVEVFALDPSEDSEEINGGEESSLASAKALLGGVKNVTIHANSHTDALWARDTGPVFVYSKNDQPVEITWGPEDNPGMGYKGINTSSKTVGLILNFNQWGKKNLPTTDAYFAGSACESLQLSSVLAPFIAEGGGLEADGEGTMLVTESAILNPNRNPGISKATMERYFYDVFGITKTIWIPGNRGFDVTDDHIDAVARFGAPGTVLLSRPFSGNGAEEGILDNYNAAKEILSKTTDAKGRRINVVDVQEPDPRILGDYDPEAGVSVAYVNFHVVNGGVMVAKFGDEKTDADAARVIGEQYPGRVVEQVPLRQLAKQGGGIHCATQQILAQP